ncbi:MAG TPA: FAD-dependent oxidoreductase [Acidimicrobiales bacterium]|nr:FAD-dependent oxidoreductase [Acidimicrobiales bacterium]
MDALAPDDHVVVVGAGLAGWRLCEGLRAHGFAGRVTLVGAEPHLPYDRPPLSKQVLAGRWDLDKVALAHEGRAREIGVELTLGVPAVGLDAASGEVDLADGTRLHPTRVALAVGVGARAFATPSSGPLTTLRTLDDAVALRDRVAALEAGETVVVVGGGFLGAEVATSLAARGLVPVVLEAAARPLIGPLGEVVAGWLAGLAAAASIELRTGVVVRDVVAGSTTWRVELEDGALEGRAVVAAVGSRLDLGWLEGSGVELDDGIVVDVGLRAAPRVAALGDAARVVEVTGERGVRREHWQVAADHAETLARAWAGVDPSPVPATPYFWSDQYGKKIQLLGRPRPDDEVVRVLGAANADRWLALYARRGVVTGAVALSQPRALMRAKPFIDAGAPLDEALADAPWEH